MHPNGHFRWDDADDVRAFVRDVGFAVLFAATPDGPRAAHMPFQLMDDDRIRFHLSRGNALTRHLDGLAALAVVNGPDAYISPDWYGVPDQVPTWNYIAVEMEGECRRLDDDELVAQVDALSAEHEARIAGKPAWTRGKMTPGVFDKLVRGIVGFEMAITVVRTTAKLGQNKAPAQREAAADALEATGKRAVAALMRTWPT